LRELKKSSQFFLKRAIADFSSRKYPRVTEHAATYHYPIAAACSDFCLSIIQILHVTITDDESFTAEAVANLDRAPGGSDRLALLIEAREGFTQAGLPRLRADLKQFLNLSPEITVLKEGELPRPPGKSVRVVDRR